MQEKDIRQAASKLVAATSDLILSIRAPQHDEAVDVFVQKYTDFHTSVMAALPSLKTMQERAESLELLEV